MEDTIQKSYKLNIFALPNQTTILFGLTVIVLIGTIFAGSFGTQPFVWPLALGLLFLPLRAFLAWPERQFRKHNLTRASDEFADLIDVIEEESRAIGLSRVAELVIGQGDIDLHIFGSPRHWYIALSHSEALRLKADLEEENRVPAVHAMFTHELYHFKNGDYWQMGYVRDLLRTAAVFMTWAIAFLLGYGFFLLLVQPDFLQLDFTALVNQLEMLPPEIRELYLSMLPSAEAWAEVQGRAAEIDLSSVLYFIANITLPFIIIGSILWLFYWRKLLRIREIYADAGVAHAQKGIDHLHHAFLLGSRTEFDSEGIARLSLLGNIKRWITHVSRRVRSALTPPIVIRRWFSKHPEFQRRVDALEDPVKAYDHWLVTALSLGSLALILDILLSTPLVLPYHGQLPMHFSVLVISVVVTLALMTPLILGEPVWRRMLEIVGVVIALRLIWLMLTIGLMLSLLILAPDVLSEVLISAITSIARYTRPLTGPVFDDLNAFVLEASLINMAQVLIVWVSLVLLIGINILLLRHLFTWYSLPQGERMLMKAAYGTIAMTTVFFGLTILTPATTALLRSEDLASPFVVMVGVLGSIIVATALGLFLYANRRYARRCPSCGAYVPGPYRLGKRCENCDELLHPWMIAEYEL